MSITISIDDTAVLAALDRLRERVTDTRPAMQDIGDDIMNRVKDGFRESRDPWGPSWQKLSIVTMLKRRHGVGFGSDKPLVDTGALANSFSALADATSVTIGTNWMADRISTGAAIHQFGGQAGRGRQVTIPARPFLPIRNGVGEFPDVWRESIITIISQHLEAGI
jgi:phage virion morphogenesis protein